MEILTGIFEDPDGNQLLPRTDVLDTEEEIKANTESGKAAGAQVVKQVISDLDETWIKLCTLATVKSGTGAASSTLYTYTATERCIVKCSLEVAGGEAGQYGEARITGPNGRTVGYVYASAIFIPAYISDFFLLEAGESVTFSCRFQSGKSGSYTVKMSEAVPV